MRVDPSFHQSRRLVSQAKLPEKEGFRVLAFLKDLALTVGFTLQIISDDL